MILPQEVGGYLTVAITFAEAREIVHAAEADDWGAGTYQIEADGWEDATHYLVVRGAAEAMGDNPDPNFIVVPGLVPLVSTQGERHDHRSNHRNKNKSR